MNPNTYTETTTYYPMPEQLREQRRYEIASQIFTHSLANQPAGDYKFTPNFLAEVAVEYADALLTELGTAEAAYQQKKGAE